jgi:hypothetical protein
MGDEENLSGRGVMLARLFEARSLETDDEKREELFEWIDLLSYLGGGGLYGLSGWACGLMAAGDIIKPPTHLLVDRLRSGKGVPPPVAPFLAELIDKKEQLFDYGFILSPIKTTVQKTKVDDGIEMEKSICISIYMRNLISGGASVDDAAILVGEIIGRTEKTVYKYWNKDTDKDGELERTAPVDKFVLSRIFATDKKRPAPVY